MATGLAEVAGIVGLIGFSLKILQDCVVGIELISTARNFGTNADRYRARLDWEKFRLIRWGDTVEDARRDASSSKRNLDWARIQDVLAQLEVLLTDSEKLEQRFHLELDDETVSKIGARMSTDAEKCTYFNRIMRRIRPEPRLVSAQDINSKASVWIRSRWAISGRTKLNELIQEITMFVGKLWGYLDEQDMAFMVKGMQYLLGEAISRTSNLSDIKLLNDMLNSSSATQHSQSIVRPVAALGMLKEKRLALGIDVSTMGENADEGPPTSQQGRKVTIPRSVRIKSGEVIRGESGSPIREIATYRNKPVLLEWKRIQPGLEEKLKYRVEALGLLLNEAHESPLGCLPCAGFFEDIGSDRYAFVFELPLTASGTGDGISRSELLSLYAWIGTDKVPKPTLEERIAMATSLVGTVRQLHVIGWLHKAIRSENVLFCYLAGSSPSSKEISGPYLAGFSYARAAQPTEFSERPDADPEVNIYCHPESMGSQPKTFRKGFDMYALGLVLLEIGLWQRLRDVLIEASARAGYREHNTIESMQAVEKTLLSHDGPDSIMGQLIGSCPPPFCSAVSRCLSLGEKGDEDGVEESVDLQTQVLEDLKKCGVSDMVA